MKKILIMKLKKYPEAYNLIKRLYCGFSRYRIKMKYRYLSLLGYLFMLIPINSKKIVICNFFGKGYGDNGKYIAEEIINQDLDYKVVWLLKKELMKDSEFPDQVRRVKHESVRAVYELSTSKFWIDNTRKYFFPPKRKNQYYIQTWHSSVGIKKIEGDAEEYLTKEYLEVAKKDSKITDVMTSGSRFNTDRFRRAFWFDKTILNIGTPRNDILINPDKNKKEEIKKKLGINQNSKIMLYAPTFRNYISPNAQVLDLFEILTNLEKRFGGVWTAIIRYHPNLTKDSRFTQRYEQAINASNYDDMQELLLITDCLITDYSSVMFDYCLLMKPCFLYVPDLVEYYERERALNFNLDELPFLISEDLQVLQEKILSFDEETYREDVKLFLEKIGSYENGHASKKLIEYIKKL